MTPAPRDAQAGPQSPVDRNVSRRADPDAVTVKRIKQLSGKRIKQLSGDFDESRPPRGRSAQLPLSRLWLPLHRYFDW
jgi:hypothetical protein